MDMSVEVQRVFNFLVHNEYERERECVGVRACVRARVCVRERERERPRVWGGGIGHAIP
jgi:hypothetical protein